MARIKKSLMILVLATVLVNLFLICDVKAQEIDESSGYKLIYRDDANLIRAEEKELVVNAMKEIAKEANVIFYTTKSPSSSNLESVCESVCASYFGAEKTKPVVMFTIDMGVRELGVYTTGEIRKIIKNSDAAIISDNVYEYAKDENYAECAKIAFEQSYHLMSGRKIKRPMQIITNALLAVILGFLCNFTYFRITRTKNAKLEKEKPHKCTNSLDLVIDKKEIKSYSYREGEGGSGGSGSSGSSGYSGGSSGGSSSSSSSSGGSSFGSHSF